MALENREHRSLKTRAVETVKEISRILAIIGLTSGTVGAVLGMSQKAEAKTFDEAMQSIESLTYADGNQVDGLGISFSPDRQKMFRVNNEYIPDRWTYPQTFRQSVFSHNVTVDNNRLIVDPDPEVFGIQECTREHSVADCIPSDPDFVLRYRTKYFITESGREFDIDGSVGIVAIRYFRDKQLFIDDPGLYPQASTYPNNHIIFQLAGNIRIIREDAQGPIIVNDIATREELIAISPPVFDNPNIDELAAAISPDSKDMFVGIRDGQNDRVFHYECNPQVVDPEGRIDCFNPTVTAFSRNWPISIYFSDAAVYQSPDSREKCVIVQGGVVMGSSWIKHTCWDVEAEPLPPDQDQDGVADTIDNCPSNANPLQIDSDNDTSGDECDMCPSDPLNDEDADGFCADADNCPDVYNPLQEDLSDRDGIGDVCDPDFDNDGILNISEAQGCENRHNPNGIDLDRDNIPDACDYEDNRFPPENTLALDDGTYVSTNDPDAVRFVDGILVASAPTPPQEETYISWAHNPPDVIHDSATIVTDGPENSLVDLQVGMREGRTSLTMDQFNPETFEWSRDVVIEIDQSVDPDRWQNISNVSPFVALGIEGSHIELKISQPRPVPERPQPADGGLDAGDGGDGGDAGQDVPDTGLDIPDAGPDVLPDIGPDIGIDARRDAGPDTGKSPEPEPTGCSCDIKGTPRQNQDLVPGAILLATLFGINRILRRKKP